MNILLDTNVVLRLLEPGHTQHRDAFDAVRAIVLLGHAASIVPQNVYEFWTVTTRPVKVNGRGLTPDEALGELAHLESKFAVLPDEPSVFDEWKHLIATVKPIGKPAHDARLVAAMRVHGLTHLLTFNGKDFSRYAAITPLDPASVAAGQPI